MGACCGKQSKEFYTDTDVQYEKDLRIFEEQIGGFKHTFYSIYHKINFESTLVSEKKVEQFLNNNFSKEVVEIAKRPFFRKEKLFFSKKIEALLFLLSRPEQKQSSISYIDKSAYLLQEVLVNEEQTLNTPIESNNLNLKQFIKLLVDISYEITDYIVLKKNLQQSDYIKEVTQYKEKVVEHILKGLFKKKNVNLTFNCQEISEYFRDNKWFLTPGYFRDASFEISKLGHLYKK